MTTNPIQDRSGHLVGDASLAPGAVEIVAGNPDGWVLTPVVRRVYGVPDELVGWTLAAVPAEGRSRPRVETPFSDGRR